VLTFTEIDHLGKPGSKPLSFQVRVDLDSWQERESPPRRSPQVVRWVQEFLSQYPESRKAEFRAKYDDARRVARQVAAYVIDPREVVPGTLVSFADVLTGNDALSSGGRAYTHRFLHDGREYSVEDMYCPNPTCDCQAFHIKFWECVSASSGDPDEAIITTSFLGRFTFTGQIEIEKTGRRQPAEARRISRAWWGEHEYDMDLYRRRYRRVKEIGQRSLDTAPTQPPPAATSHRRTDRHPNLAPAPRLTSVEPKRVGRNDPCPCGSGRKFKRCCATHTRDSQLLAR
jgi:hypothetical protein